MKKMKESSSDDMKSEMQQWMKWAEAAGDKLVELGTPLGNGTKVTTAGAGPSDKFVIGYSIMQAENVDEIVELIKEHPHLNYSEDASIDVHESLPMPGGH